MAILISAGLVLCTSFITKSISKDTISVTGSYSQNVTSDSGQFEFELVTRQISKAKAYEVINEQRPKVIKYLEDKGFKTDEIDIKTTNGYNTYKTMPNGSYSNEIAYYNLSQRFSVSSKNVQKIKETSSDISNLISKGIDINAYEPSYFYSELSEIKVKLLGEATKDAKDRAASMLKATHNHVGKIQSVRMGVFQVTPVDSNDVSDSGISDTSSIEKKVTSVANVTFSVR